VKPWLPCLHHIVAYGYSYSPGQRHHLVELVKLGLLELPGWRPTPEGVAMAKTMRFRDPAKCWCHRTVKPGEQLSLGGIA
jgi:hypothetical protein